MQSFLSDLRNPSSNERCAQKWKSTSTLALQYNSVYEVFNGGMVGAFQLFTDSIAETTVVVAVATKGHVP